jgi:DnaK suppressor protein
MAQKKSDRIDSEIAAPEVGSAAAKSSSMREEARINTSFTDEDFAFFERLLLDRRQEAIEDIDRMRAQLEDAREQAENDTAYSFHMADAGTDAMEREKLYLMIARQQKYVGYLDRALERIKNRTYGICKVTGKPISKDRLEAVPHTEISIEAKLKQKK